MGFYTSDGEVHDSHLEALSQEGRDVLLKPPGQVYTPPWLVSGLKRIPGNVEHYLTVPGKSMQEQQPEVPGQWSDVDEARKQLSEEAKLDWGVKSGFGLTFDPMIGMFPKQFGIVPKGSVLGEGAVSKVVQPETKAASESLARVEEGIIAYHGSPHDFDKFSTDFIGTGEGAQAYGHGLYFAENPKVAAEYRRMLGDSSAKTPMDVTANDWIYKAGGDKQKALQMFEEHANKAGLGDKSKTLIKDAIDNSPGKTYEVKLKANKDKFLDWEGPLPKSLSDEFQVFGKYIKYSGTNPLQLLDKLKASGLTDKQATETLVSKGIEGIRYLDQGSRRYPELAAELKVLEDKLKTEVNPKHAEGISSQIKYLTKELEQKPTYNYVVFDDKKIDILRKYGWAGLAAAMELGYRDHQQ